MSLRQRDVVVVIMPLMEGQPWLRGILRWLWLRGTGIDRSLCSEHEVRIAGVTVPKPLQVTGTARPSISAVGQQL